MIPRGSEHRRPPVWSSLLFVLCLSLCMRGYASISNKRRTCHEKFQTDLNCVLENGAWVKGHTFDYEYQAPLIKSSDREQWSACGRPVQQYVWQWDAEQCPNTKTLDKLAHGIGSSRNSRELLDEEDEVVASADFFRAGSKYRSSQRSTSETPADDDKDSKAETEDTITKNSRRPKTKASTPSLPTTLKPLYTREEMCSIVGGRNIMMVGDSINNQWFVTMASMLWPPSGPAMTIHDVVHLNRKIVHNNDGTDTIIHFDSASNCVRIHIACSVAEDSFSLLFIRNFNLSTNYEVHPSYWRSTEDMPTLPDIPRVWVPLIAKENIDILILNRGAHYADDIEDKVKETLNFVIKKYPSLNIIWRNTPAGHKDCGDHLNAKPMLLTDMHADQEAEVKKFNWGKIWRLNFKLQAMLASDFPQVVYLDVEKSTALRADGHMSADDCLHYCIPGPIDNWVSYLMHALLLQHYYACDDV